ncbi:hypothetical protein GP486_005767 [Trichoglossum hirsutum]|uniref:F-box domain-containing protein n=1 Tax=Trichoglossum hirsutum TaxID=265104 RepID=A0A9P8L8J3_9PEZI|nr:hypothetical protein GP486_005767 [Trichoglossum hirsutum]
MDLFRFPTEIRLQIYSELLVSSERIVFAAEFATPSPPLFRPKRNGLWPALLRANKMVYSEASPLLYSNNCFQFPNGFASGNAIWAAYYSPFINKIGSQASFIRYICITTPTAFDSKHGRARLHDYHVKNLKLIRDTCTSLTTFELYLATYSTIYPGCKLHISRVSADALMLVAVYLKAIAPLKKIIVNFRAYGEKYLGDYKKELSDHLTKRMNRCGWTTRTIRLEIPTKTLISDDEECGYFSEEDFRRCMHYNDYHRRDKEERMLVVGTFTRTDDPY